MNLSTLIALIIVAALFCLASIYLYKNGTCGACPDAPNCNGHCSRDNKKAIKKSLKENAGFKEKSDMIDDIIKKHKV